METPALIKPTVGRVVWFFPNNFWCAERGIAYEPGEPLAATIAFVHTDRLVNLSFADANGVSFNATSVKLLQENDAPTDGDHFCMWMPYQKGQAAKTEQVEQELKGCAQCADECQGHSAAGGVGPGTKNAEVRLFLNRGAMVKVNGIPLFLEHDTVVRTHPANVALLGLDATDACKSEVAD